MPELVIYMREAGSLALLAVLVLHLVKSQKEITSTLRKVAEALAKIEVHLEHLEK